MAGNVKTMIVKIASPKLNELGFEFDKKCQVPTVGLFLGMETLGASSSDLIKVAALGTHFELDCLLHKL